MFLGPTKAAELDANNCQHDSDCACSTTSMDTSLPLPGKSKAVQPWRFTLSVLTRIFQVFNFQHAWISLAGPIFLKRLFSATGTAWNDSSRSAPNLCLLLFKKKKKTSLFEEEYERMGKKKLTLSTASIKMSIPCFFAVSHAWRNSWRVPHLVATVPFWSNSPKSHYEIFWLEMSDEPLLAFYQIVCIVSASFLY